MRFKAPNGSPIIGTLERLSGRAEAEHYSETGVPEYDGSTEIFYDDQETVTRQIGDTVSLVYLAQDGEDYTFDQLLPDTNDDDAVG